MKMMKSKHKWEVKQNGLWFTQEIQYIYSLYIQYLPPNINNINFEGSNLSQVFLASLHYCFAFGCSRHTDAYMISSQFEQRRR